MKAAIATILLAGCVMLLAGEGLALEPETQDPALDAQYKAAQVEVMLATARLGLVQVQMRIKSGQLPQARQDLDRSKEMLASLASQTDVSAYAKVAEKLAGELAAAEAIQRAKAAAPPPTADPPGAATDPGQGYGNRHSVAPTEPGLPGQVAAAVEQVKLGEDQAYTNVKGSRGELVTDPAVVKQRTLDHQGLWDDGRYAPAKELIDTGKMLELDRERIHYQYAIGTIRAGADRDEILHVTEAAVPPPQVMNYPANWQEISQKRAPYADGVLWKSAPFKDADGKEKTVAIYDVSDLLFVPIFPGPSEYNVLRPRDPLQFWTNQDRARDGLVHPPFSWFGPDYNGPIYGGGMGGPAGRGGQGGYYGYPVTSIIGSAYYFPYEADPIYQYRLAQKRAELLKAVSAMMSAQQD